MRFDVPSFDSDVIWRVLTAFAFSGERLPHMSWRRRDWQPYYNQWGFAFGSLRKTLVSFVLEFHQSLKRVSGADELAKSDCDL